PANEVSPDSDGIAKPANEVAPDSTALIEPTGALPDTGCAAKPANEVAPDLPAPANSPRASRCEPFLEFIELSLAKGRNAKGIWQTLVDDQGFSGGYSSVKRFVRKLRGPSATQARAVITTPVGEEGQVDYGSGPMVRDPHNGRYRRTRMFVLTLGFSRKAVRILTWHSNTPIWAELHERAFRRLGGTPRLLVLDNLGEGVLRPDIYDPTTIRFMPTCWRTTAPPPCLAASPTRIARARWSAPLATPSRRL